MSVTFSYIYKKYESWINLKIEIESTMYMYKGRDRIYKKLIEVNIL